MPAGLDGNPKPLVSPARDQVLSIAAAHVERIAAGKRRALVAIDGRPGSGKSTFADELCSMLALSGVDTLRSTTDSFHRPRSERLRAGSRSAAGYYQDSHRIDEIVDSLLEPFASGADQVQIAAFDEPSDSPAIEVVEPGESSVLMFDGLFLQRPEFESHWDLSVYLVADARLDERWLDFLLSDLPDDPSESARTVDNRLERARWPRYRQGWGAYVVARQPQERADLVIDNNDLARPFFDVDRRAE